MKLKTAINAVLVAAAALGGAAHAGNVTNLPSAAGGSDFVLFVTDKTLSTFYEIDLGVQLDAARTKAQVTADPVYNDTTTAGPLTIPAGLAGTQANLATFLSHTGDNYVWSILASDTTGTGSNSGDKRFAVTSNQDILGNFVGNSEANASSVLNLSFFQSVNSAVLTNHTSTLTGYGDTAQGKNAPVGFDGPNLANGAAIGVAQTLWMIATNSDPTNADNDLANTYSSATGVKILLDSTGKLSISGTPVPIPAAIWLLGSGLLGLAGVGRRKLAAA